MKIFIAAPANVASGGPELLHQLGHKLSLFGYEAYMLYYGEECENPVHGNYKKYNVKYAEEYIDDEDSVLVIPEVVTSFIQLVKRSKVIIWWLSVDNYLYQIQSKIETGNIWDKNILHLAQSVYAKEFLERINIPHERIHYLSDYLNSTYIENVDWSVEKKENIILFNPLKGYEFTKKIINRIPDLTWKPLINLSHLQMSELMKRSKLYLDFGSHPGKDRIPREAAISGCCIITGKRGSAGNNVDICIDNEFKFNDREESIDAILFKIQEVFCNYENKIEQFKIYRDRIIKEEEQFEFDLRNVLKVLEEN